MNYPPPGQHMAQNFRPMPNRRQSDYHYPAPVQYPPLQYQYLGYPQGPQYPLPPQFHYQGQWYQPYQQHYVPPQAPRQLQPHSPMVVSSHPHMHPGLSLIRLPAQTQTPQPTPTPQPDQSTPSTVSHAITSTSPTPPTTASVSTSTPPVATPKPSSTTAAATAPSPTTSSATPPTQRVAFFPKLPWHSVPESDFPPRISRRRRRRRAAQIPSDEVELPARQHTTTTTTFELVQDQGSTVLADVLPITNDSTSARVPSVRSGDGATPEPALAEASADPEKVSPMPLQPVSGHRRTATKPVFPAVPVLPIAKSQKKPSATAISPLPAQTVVSVPLDQTSTEVSNEVSKDDVGPPSTSATPEPAPLKAQPKSWAELFARGPAAHGVSSAAKQPGQTPNGTIPSNSNTLGDVLHAYTANGEGKLSFLQPRGLVNTGNMCYMNSILQVLVSCVPFYEFLDQIGKRVAHSFKSDTPLVEAMIMFMREYPVIDSAVSVDQLRFRLKESELEQYGESFIPEYVYDVIKRLPRFSTMRRGHQQDAEEFLGFLLEGLHDECVHVIKNNADETALINGFDGVKSPASERSAAGSSTAEAGWLEVGPKQKASVTRSSGAIVTESPITKIFGGKLRSVLRVPGLKDSVTLEPYQPLQLDIGAPNVNNITDALRGLTHSETLHGEFNSPRGPGSTATKQVFIETLPPVLILHLKRFQYDNAGGTQKIWRKIGYPLDLEIPKEVFPQSQRAALTIRPAGLPKYRLISVVYHHGKSASGGHYTVDVRRQDGREWIRLDDTVIRRIRPEDVANEGSEEDPRLLAKALEQHKRDSETPGSSNIYNRAFGGDDEREHNEDSQVGWSQVNGSAKSPAATVGVKEGPSVTNGAAVASKSSATTPGRQTPRASAKASVKDNKVAYILFYQRVEQ